MKAATIAPLVILILHLFPNRIEAARMNTTGLRVVFYNVENLFDTTDNPTTDDNEFTPSGARRWTTKRYWNKLNNIARVVVTVGGEKIPAVVGLCEIENDSVLFDLTRRSALRTLNYHYIAAQTGDPRGVRTALLYQPDQIRPISTTSHPVELPGRSSKRATRHILHVCAHTQSGDTLDLFVCHFPSRLGGIPQTEPDRIAAAQTLRTLADSLFATRKKPKLVLMGDFNDNPSDKSLTKALRTKPTPTVVESTQLYNTTETRADHGSYKYQGTWYRFDQIIVSGLLYNKQATIFAPKFLLTPELRQLGSRPNSTFNGFAYRGGYSDHLPIWLDIDP